MQKALAIVGWRSGLLGFSLLAMSLVALTTKQPATQLHAQAVTPIAATQQLYLPLITQGQGADAPSTPNPTATTRLVTVTPTPITPTTTVTATTATTTPTNTPTTTPTPTASATATLTPSFTPSVTPTDTATNTPTSIVTPTLTPTPTITPTPTVTPPQEGTPAPCNQAAQDLTLTLADLPTGWSLLEAGPQTPGDEVVQLGAVDSYAARYINYLQLLTGTSGGVSVVIVFRDEQGAHAYLQLLQETFALDPSYEPITLPSYGEESLAYRQSTNENGLAFTNYHIYLRQNNVASVVTTVALATAATTADVQTWAGRAVAKICTT